MPTIHSLSDKYFIDGIMDKTVMLTVSKDYFLGKCLKTYSMSQACST